jgi:hypothetical protein
MSEEAISHLLRRRGKINDLISALFRIWDHIDWLHLGFLEQGKSIRRELEIFRSMQLRPVIFGSKTSMLQYEFSEI